MLYTIVGPCDFHGLGTTATHKMLTIMNTRKPTLKMFQIPHFVFISYCLLCIVEILAPTQNLISTFFLIFVLGGTTNHLQGK